MTFEEFCLRARSELNKHRPDQRPGQIVWNYLDSVRPDLARCLRGTMSDPYYSDSKLVDFYGCLAFTWDLTKTLSGSIDNENR